MPKIESICIGTVAPLLTRSGSEAKVTSSAIGKRPVSSVTNPIEIRVTRLGLEGDEQADLSVHGGPEKAIYAYPSEHYSFWADLLEDATGTKPQHELGQIGENLTTVGLDEHSVWVGDIWQIGDVSLQIVKQREPCFKFNIRMGYRGAAKAMLQSSKCGWYLRVLKEGYIRAGQTIVIEPGPRTTSIYDLNVKTSKNQSELF
jgi:MOSC domain-containing protein YiiM